MVLLVLQSGSLDLNGQRSGISLQNISLNNSRRSDGGTADDDKRMEEYEMAAEFDEEMFKTTLMGGFDKEDVLTKFQEARDEAYKEQKKLEAQVEERDKLISELRQSLKNKETENEQLQKDIKEKYQSYIDNYDSIGKLVYDAKVRSDNMMSETKQQCDQMPQGRDSYRIIRNEMAQMVQAMNELQKGFLESYKKVRTVKDAMDRSAQKLEPFFRQLQEDTVKEKEAGKSGKKTEEKSSGSKAKKVPEEEEFLDDGVDFDEELENEIHRLLKDEEESEDGGQG